LSITVCSLDFISAIISKFISYHLKPLKKSKEISRLNLHVSSPSNLHNTIRILCIKTATQNQGNYGEREKFLKTFRNWKYKVKKALNLTRISQKWKSTRLLSTLINSMD